MKNKIKEGTRIRLPLIFIATLIMLANNYWISSTWSGDFTHVSLFLNAVFITFIIALLNLLLRKIKSSLAFRPSELLLIYVMLAVATGATGHDTVEMLTQVVGYPFWFATAENEWEDIFFRYLPKWLMVDDKNVLEGFYKYDEEFYRRGVFVTWLRPLLLWASFLSTFYFCMMCINIVFRKQWMERERLSFPVAQVPLGLMDSKNSILQKNIFWYGFGIAFLLSLLNGLHRLHPLIPGPTYGKFDFSALLTEKPWNAIEGVYIEFLPFVLGLAFFIPVSLSFSIWFFYWFWKIEMVIGSAIGFQYLPGFPGYGAQGMGAVILMFIFFLFWSRQHLLQVLKTVFHIPHIRSDDYIEDAGLYTFAVVGLILGMVFLVSFCYYAGMSYWVAIVFLGGAYIVSTVLTRARAELGPPTHDFPFTPASAITNFFGSKRIDGSSLTQFAMFKFVDYGNRSNVMPHILEGLYLKHKLKLEQKWIVITAIVIAIVLGSMVGLIGNVHRGYEDVGQTWVGRSFPTVANQLKYPSGTNHLYIIYCLIGGIVITLLATLNRYFVWWPLHPLGYILGGEWLLRYLWFSIFIAWLIKWLSLKFGGMDVHRKLTPFFMGVTIGDAVMIAIWSIYGNLFNKWTLGLLYW